MGTLSLLNAEIIALQLLHPRHVQKPLKCNTLSTPHCGLVTSIGWQLLDAFWLGTVLSSYWRVKGLCEALTSAMSSSFKIGPMPCPIKYDIFVLLMEKVSSVSGLLNIAQNVSPMPSLERKLKLSFAVLVAQMISALVVSSFLFITQILVYYYWPCFRCCGWYTVGGCKCYPWLTVTAGCLCKSNMCLILRCML